MFVLNESCCKRQNCSWKFQAVGVGGKFLVRIIVTRHEHMTTIALTFVKLNWQGRFIFRLSFSFQLFKFRFSFSFRFFRSFLSFRLLRFRFFLTFRFFKSYLSFLFFWFRLSRSFRFFIYSLCPRTHIRDFFRHPSLRFSELLTESCWISLV